MKMNRDTSCMSLETTEKKGTRYKRALAGVIILDNTKNHFNIKESILNN